MTMCKVLIIGNINMNRTVSGWWENKNVEMITIPFNDQFDNVVTKGLLDRISDVDLVLETITGMTKHKKALITFLDQHISATVPCLTSTLHYSATEISSWSKEPTRYIGFHPLHFDQMKVIEIAPALQSSERIVQSCVQILEAQGKSVEQITDTVAGVFPRTLALIINEAIHALDEGIATKEDIDLAMKKGTNYPFGPLEWADNLGLDEILWILEGLHREFGDDRYRSAPLLRKKVWANHLGITTGKGFYSYE
jgi:3-hydroxybutyryl-CoA dehydrogenase